MHRRQSRGRQACGALTYSRPPYRCGLEASCLGTLIMITHAPKSRSCAPSWTGLSVARLYVGVVQVLSFVARSILRKETCLLEGQVSCNALLARALTLGVSRGVLTGCSDPLPAPCHVLACLVGKAAKRTTGRVLVPYHASRD